MKIIVFMKQVPDMNAVKFDPVNKKIDRSSAGTEINPYDMNALEAALEISEKTDAEVIAVSMGPKSGKDVIIDAIARGADRGILLSDRVFGGADTKATALTLKAACEKIDGAYIILCGEKTVDGDTGQVGAELAQFLDIPHISYVEKISDVSTDCIVVQNNILDSLYEITSPYPVLLTVTKDVNTPRLPSIKGKMRAKKTDIPIWSFDDLSAHITESEVGSKGSPTKVYKIEITPPMQRKARIANQNEDMETFIDTMFEELETKRIF